MIFSSLKNVPICLQGNISFQVVAGDVSFYTRVPGFCIPPIFFIVDNIEKLSFVETKQITPSSSQVAKPCYV